MTDTLTGSLTDLEILLALDFEHTPACEHSQHPVMHRPSDPARFIVGSRPCVHCGGTIPDYLICLSGWHHLGVAPIHCISCQGYADRDALLYIIRDLKGN